jgi:hypothetical protein
LELITLYIENNYLIGNIPDEILTRINSGLFKIKVCPQKFGPELPYFGNYSCH